MASKSLESTTLESPAACGLDLAGLWDGVDAVFEVDSVTSSFFFFLQKCFRNVPKYFRTNLNFIAGFPARANPSPAPHRGPPADMAGVAVQRIQHNSRDNSWACSIVHGQSWKNMDEARAKSKTLPPV